jgi:transposase
MRLVPETNTQKPSVPRLRYKAFVGNQASPVREEEWVVMSEPMPSTKSEPEWAAFAAIDWADQKHFWRLVPADTRQQEQGELENTPEAVEVWAASLQQRFDSRPIAVCLEQARGALIYMLSKYAHLVLFPVHPTTAARYRETFCTSGAKDDPNDTASLLDLLLRHRERLRQLQPDTEETRLLQFLVEERRQVVNEKTRQSNRLTDCLKLYFPQILRWFDDVGTPLVGDLLERWPNLEQLQRAHPGTLRKFFNEHNCRSAERNQERIEAIYAAVSATNDAAVLEAGVLTASGLVALIRTLRDNVARLDHRIEQLVATHPEGALFASLPGAGPVLVPRLIVAFGTRRERYDTAYEVQCYSGIAPVKEASGKISWVHFRRACPMFLRQTFHEFALHSIGQSEWAKAYYDHLRKDEKKTHHAAVRSLAYKWIRIIFRCWKDGKPYDEDVYLNSLRRRGSQLGAALALATGLGWQTVAGFQRLSENNA